MADAPTTTTADGQAADQGQANQGIWSMYKDPQPLSNDRHANLGLIRSSQPYEFARELHLAPLTVGEFGQAALNYPIIFAGDARTPLAVMGLRAGENLFIDDQGRLEERAYVPAFVRRYPFVVVRGDQDNNVVCIDAGSSLVSDQPDQPFFDGKEPTQYTKDAIEFLKNFDQQSQLTAQLSSLLSELDLFEEKSVTYQPRDPQGGLQQPVKLADYYAISMEKLKDVSAQKFLELRDTGALAAVYAHNFSLFNWRFILERAMKRQQSTPGDVVN